MKPQAILFDLDGTLINTLPDIVGVVNRVREELGLGVRPQPEIVRYIGKGAEVLVEGCFGEVLKLHSIEALVARFRSRYYLEPHHGGHLYAGVEHTLDTLRRSGLQIGVATNKPERAAQVTLQHYLPDFTFDIVACPENVSGKKPDPAHLTEPLQQLSVSNREAVFVGDDPVDLAAATAAGVRFFGAGFGFGNVKAPQMLQAFTDLLDYLGELQ